MAYYAYLPALIIYDDPSYSFLDENVEKYYFEGAKKQFLVELENGEKVNKTYPGAAILYLPFFLIAHFLAMLFGDPDGFSLIYQVLFEVGHFFYVFIGIALAIKILQLKGVNLKQALITIGIMILTTNYFYYSLVDLSLIHIHSMALINGVIYLLLTWERSNYINRKNLLYASLLFGMALITRPTDILMSLLVLVFLDKRKESLRRLFMVEWKRLPLYISLILVVFIIPVLLWRWQAGVWYAYSYGEEGFDFIHPETLNFLFSYNNGWFVYTPILLIIFPLGFWLLLKSDRFGAIWGVIFYGVSIYIFSSWWCWYYGCSFGQRTVVDFYLLVAYLVSLIVINIKSKWSRNTAATLVVFFSFLNIHQSYQNFKGYIECGMTTSEMYWDNFLRFRKLAKVYLNEGDEVVISRIYTLDDSNSEVTGNMTNSEDAYSGNVMTTTTPEFGFSATINTDFLKGQDLDYLIISCYIFKRGKIENSTMVVEQPNVPNSYKRFWLRDYAASGKWVKVEYQYFLVDRNAPLRVYVWNGDSGEENWYDQIEIKGVKSKK